MSTRQVITVVDSANLYKLYRTLSRTFHNPDGTVDSTYGSEETPGVLLHDIPNVVAAMEYLRDPETGEVLADALGAPKVALDEQNMPKYGPVVMTWSPTYYCMNPDDEVKRYRGAWLATGGGTGVMTAHMHLSAAVGHQVVIGGTY